MNFPRRRRKITLDAVYRDGVILPETSLEVPENAQLRVTVELLENSTEAIQSPWALRRENLWHSLSRVMERLKAIPQALPLDADLFFQLALVLYAITRLMRLSDFPIYFFSDEAVHALLAEELIRNHFRDSFGTLFPAYFKNYQVWNLSLSVYVHTLTVWLFGKSIFITRATSAVITLFGTAAVGLILRWAFHLRFWWIGVLVMTVTPAWFLHSRTAFETAMMVSLYALFLLCYLLYRCRSPRYLYPAILFAAATFYAYTNGQAVIGVTALWLAISDLRYHWQQRRTVAIGLGLAALLAVPYVCFRLEHPTELAYHLRILDSYWLRDLPLGEKLARFVKTYLYGLSLQYWFFPNDHDLIRHRMKGYYGHLRLELLPFFLLGIGLCLRRWRSAPHRAVLLSILATPVGAALVDVGITRVLAFVVPASLLISIGLDWALERVSSRLPSPAVELTCFGLFAVMSLWMLRDAVLNGPRWYADYGLYGMQYGAKQLFEIIPEYLERDPAVEILLSPTWANGADLFPRFFLDPSDLPRVKTLNVDAFMVKKRPLTENMLFIMTHLEYDRARKSNKFKAVRVERVLPYPDGSPGFYFARLAYADNVDAIFAAEREARRRLVEAQVQIDDQLVKIRHSLLDAGRVNDMFDGDWYTLGRVMEANPAIIELTFPQPRSVSGIVGDFGSMDFEWTIHLYAEGSKEPTTYKAIYRNMPPDPHVEITFDRGPEKVVKIRMEIKDLRTGETAKIHIRELKLK